MQTRISSLQHKQTLLRIMIFTLVTVIIWVGLTLFRTQRQTGISATQQQLAEPLNPNIDINVLNRLEQKRYYSPEELADFPVYSVIVTKSGEEQTVVFSAADHSLRTVLPQPAIESATISSPAPQETPTAQ